MPNVQKFHCSNYLSRAPRIPLGVTTISHTSISSRRPANSQARRYPSRNWTCKRETGHASKPPRAAFKPRTKSMAPEISPIVNFPSPKLHLLCSLKMQQYWPPMRQRVSHGLRHNLSQHLGQ